MVSWGLLVLHKACCAAIDGAVVLPPILPEEYSYNFREDYEATSLVPARMGEVFDRQTTAGTQFWSLASLSQRAMVSAGEGVSSTLPDPALNHLTVTNFSDPSARGSLVVDLIAGNCSYTANEGASGYQGYDYYRNFVAQALAAGVAVRQWNVSDWSFSGQHFGPASIWQGTPPTGDPLRVLTYTIVFAQGTNHLIGYIVNGTEQLPNVITGEPELVSMRSVDVRTDWHTNAAADWAAGFFDGTRSCPWPVSVSRSATDPV